MCILKSKSYSLGIELHFFLPHHCWFIMNINMHAQSTADTERWLQVYTIKTAAMWIHRLNSIRIQATVQPYLGDTHRHNPHNMESIEFRLCASLLCLFASLSIFSIWLLCKQCNSTTNPLIFTSPQCYLRVGALQQYMNGKLLSCGHWYRDISFTFQKI